MNDSYELRLYDDTLLSFSLTSGVLAGYSVEITQICEPRALLPIDMELTGDGVLKWLERRVIPRNRTFVEEILRAFGLSIGNTKGIIDVCKGLSLNDSYCHWLEFFSRFSSLLAVLSAFKTAAFSSSLRLIMSTQ